MGNSRARAETGHKSAAATKATERDLVARTGAHLPSRKAPLLQRVRRASASRSRLRLLDYLATSSFEP